MLRALAIVGAGLVLILVGLSRLIANGAVWPVRTMGLVLVVLGLVLIIRIRRREAVAPGTDGGNGIAPKPVPPEISQFLGKWGFSHAAAWAAHFALGLTAT